MLRFILPRRRRTIPAALTPRDRERRLFAVTLAAGAFVIVAAVFVGAQAGSVGF